MSEEKTQIESWRPSEIGEAIIGKLVWKGQHETKYGMKNAYIIVGEDGTSFKLWGNKNIDPQLQPLSIRDKISVAYLGIKPLVFRDGRPMKDKDGNQLHQKQYKVILISGAQSTAPTNYFNLSKSENHLIDEYLADIDEQIREKEDSQPKNI